jgi:hypothetical protein
MRRQQSHQTNRGALFRQQLEDSSSQMMRAEDEEELSQPASAVANDLGPLEFARLHGLCEDFTATKPLELCASSLKRDSNVQKFEDPQGVFHLDPSIHFYHPEKLEVPKAAQAFIQSVLGHSQPPFLESMRTQRPYSKHLRLELPLLSTDNELDVLCFGQRPVPNFQNVTFPREEVDTENDEGLQWPSTLFDLPQKYQQKIEEDKYEVDSSATKYLLSVIRNTPVEDEMDALFRSEITYIQVK